MFNTYKWKREKLADETHYSSGRLDRFYLVGSATSVTAHAEPNNVAHESLVAMDARSINPVASNLSDEGLAE